MANLIRFRKRPKLKSAYLIAAWPGMGEVAYRAVTFLKEKLNFEEFAYLEANKFFPAESVEIHNQEISIPVYSGGRYYFCKYKNIKEGLIIFINDRQPPQELAYEYAKKVLEITNFIKIKRVFTFAAMPAAIEHNINPSVFAVATKKELLKEIKPLGIKPIFSGQISGLNGLFLGVASLMNIPGICLLGEIPLYTIHIANPRASFAVLDIFCRFLNIKIDLNPLLNQANSLDEEIEKLVDYLKISSSNEPISEDEIEKIKKALSLQTKLPDSAKRNIERLFKEAKEDISKAGLLKQELDKWNVYKEYEDRFLDLFRKSKKEEN
jgi:hypothetical protein